MLRDQHFVQKKSLKMKIASSLSVIIQIYYSCTFNCFFDIHDVTL